MAAMGPAAWARVETVPVARPGGGAKEAIVGREVPVGGEAFADLVQADVGDADDAGEEVEGVGGGVFGGLGGGLGGGRGGGAVGNQEGSRRGRWPWIGGYPQRVPGAEDFEDFWVPGFPVVEDGEDVCGQEEGQEGGAVPAGLRRRRRGGRPGCRRCRRSRIWRCR